MTAHRKPSDRNPAPTPAFKAALLGAGYIADYHLEALRRVPNARLVAVCDLGRTRAERLAERVPGAAAFTDVAEMLASAAPDVVHVLTPPTAHLGPARACLEGGAAVLVEKPLATSVGDCRALGALAEQRGRMLGTSFNFLFAPPYERFATDLRRARFGRIDQLDVVWNKPLPQVQFGPWGWLFDDPRNVLFEVAPHSFAHVVHVLGLPAAKDIQARAWDPVRVPDGKLFYRQWQVDAAVGRASVRLRFSFIDGYVEHYLHLRGSAGTATVDFDLNTYVPRENTQDLLDLDHLATSVRNARETLTQAAGTWGSFVLAKMGLPFDGGPYQASITRAVARFYEAQADASQGLDARLAPALATDAIAFAEAVAGVVELSPAPAADTTARASAKSSAPLAQAVSAPAAAPAPGPTTAAGRVLVLGGTGFIGRALVKRLTEEGVAVRALVRSRAGHAVSLAEMGVELVHGDFTDTASIAAALEGIDAVYHLARGFGRTWEDYLKLDVEPTQRLAELLAARGIPLYYTSSIAIYDAGRAGDVITESTAPGRGAVGMNVYARAKAESERILFDLHKSAGLKVVVFRPGIVVGAGGSPYHWGVGAWPYSSICRIWGDGHQALPFVLVEDCADAMVRARAVPGLWGESFNLVGEVPLTGHEYLDELERRAGIKVRRLPVPTWRRFAEDVVKWGVKTAGRSSDRKTPSYRYYEGLSCRARFSAEHAKQRLGWRPTEDRAALVERGIALPAAEFLG